VSGEGVVRVSGETGEDVQPGNIGPQLIANLSRVACPSCAYMDESVKRFRPDRHYQSGWMRFLRRTIRKSQKVRS